MSSINLGGFNTSDNGVSGLGFLSNLDGEALIEGALSGRQFQIDESQDRIDVNSQKIAAVGELQTLVDRLKTTSNFLRSPPGFSNETNDFFQYTTSSLTSSTAIPASNYLSVTSEAGATTGSYSVNNISQAKANQIVKSGFTSATESIVGSAAVTDNYQINTSDITGSVLNASSPIEFTNDVAGEKANITLEFSADNEFDSDDSIIIGSSDLRFGSGSGTADIIVGSTTAETLENIANYLNNVTTGDEANYNYSTDGNSLIIERNTTGNNSQVKTDLNISADLSSSGSNQTIAIGSEAASNNPVGGTLNILGNDGNQGDVGTNATLDIIFGAENNFDAEDEITFGDTTITFGGTGDSDLDISNAETIDDKIDVIVNYLNSLSTGPESTYTYSRSASQTLNLTQDNVGNVETLGNDIQISANFSIGEDDLTQTFQIGQNFKNNGSEEGGIAKSNSLISGSVSKNGVNGIDGAVKSNIEITFSNNNIDSGDTITFGDTTATFGTDITVGATLEDTLDNIAIFFNNLDTGAETNYKFENNGVDKLVVTAKDFGNSVDLNVDADLSNGADTANIVQFGSQAGSNNPDAGDLETLGVQGIAQAQISDNNSSYIRSLKGAINITGANFIEGSAVAGLISANQVQFKATVNGETYTSKPIKLEGANIAASGSGDNGIGSIIPANTEITFVKDIQEGDSSKKNLAFKLITGDEKTINNANEASNFATEIDGFLNTTNSIEIRQFPTITEFRAGTFSLGGVNINIKSGDNLEVLRSKINSVAALSGVQADIIKVGNNNYSIVLKSTETGIDNKIAEFGDGDVGDGTLNTIQIGLDNVGFTQLVEAKDATFDLDGQTITRSSNVIGDAIDGITFSLESDTPDAGTIVNVDIDHDTNLIKTGISDFLNAYNELRFFISEQTERDENNNLTETAVLGDESVLRDILTSVDAQLNRTVQGIQASGFGSLFELGIDVIDFPGNEETPETRNIFVIDNDKFDSAISSNFEAVRDVFSFTFNANSPDLSVFSRTNNSSLTNYVLDIDDNREAGDRVRVLDGSDNSFLFNATLEGTTIKGNEGTSLEGLVLIYTGDGSDIINVNQSQGVADGLFNLLDSYLQDGGLIENTVESFKSDNDRLTDRIERDNISLAVERQILVDQFTRLESVIADANNTLNFLSSQQDADNQ